MQFTLYTSDVVGNRANCLYPHAEVITNEGDLATAVARDHVAARYKDSYRSKDRFEVSDVLTMDIDNTDSDDPNDWMTADKLEAILPTTQYFLVPSRNHMKVKDGRAARPKYHVFFPIEECDNAEVYAGIKVEIQKQLTFFDPNALDAARFLFGCQVTPSDIICHDGWETIEEALSIDREELDSFTKDTIPSGQVTYSKIIPKGARNNTLSRFASRILKRYGVSDKTFQLFTMRAGDCEEPLGEDELYAIWNSAVGFYNKKVLADPTYKAPDEYSNDFGQFSLKPDDYSDAGEAAVFAREYNDIVRYTAATHYINYVGECWEESDLSGFMPYMEFIDLQLADARETYQVANDNLIAVGFSKEAIEMGGKALIKECANDEMAKALDMYDQALRYLKFVMKHRDYRSIQATVNTARTMLRADVNDFDKDGFLLNTPGLTIDLKTDQTHAPTPTDLITKQTRFAPGDEGMDIWLAALDTFFCGDAELIEYVQKIMGIATIGEVFIEALIIAWGSGKNGKSSFFNSIAYVLGSYSGTISAESLTVGCRHNARPEMAELKGKRFVIAAELEDGMRLSTSVVKKLCSTDEIAAEQKYKNPFKYRPSHTLTLYTNHLPRVGVSDDGTWRRLIVIPFNAKIEGDSEIKNYTNYLTENAGPAIMKWLIEGAKKAIADDFKIEQPKVVKDAIAKYRDSNDWLGLFISECCDVGDGYKQKSGELYQEYRTYCVSRNEYIRSTSDFYSALDAAGYTRQKMRDGSYVYGLMVKVSDFLE